MIKRAINFGLNLGLSKTAKAVYWVFSGNAVSVVLAFFITVIIARFLSKEDFGLYLALFTFAALLADLADVGIGSSLSNFLPPLISQNKIQGANEILGTAFYLELIFGGVIFILSIIFSPLIAKFLFNGVAISNVFIAILIMILILLSNFSTFALTSQKKFKETSLINISTNILRLVLLIIVVYKFTLNLNNVLIIYLISLFFSWFYSLFYLRLEFTKFLPNMIQIKKLLKFSGFLGLQKIFITISSRLDMLMLVPLAGSLSAGIYGAASRILQIYPFFISGFGLVTAPKYAEFDDHKKALHFFYKTLSVVSIFLISIIFLYIFADKFILLLFPKYVESIAVFRVLLISTCIFVITSPFTTLLIYTLKKPGIMAISTGVSLIIIFAGNIIFIPMFHEIGPAISLGIGNLAMLLICGISVWKFYVKKI